MKSRVDYSGLALGAPVDLSLPSKEDVLTQVFEQCDFIQIQKPETSLVVVNAENNKLFTEVREALKECLKENGIETSDIGNKKFEMIGKDNKTISKGQSQTVQTRDKSQKRNEDERGF